MPIIFPNRNEISYFTQKETQLKKSEINDNKGVNGNKDKLMLS